MCVSTLALVLAAAPVEATSDPLAPTLHVRSLSVLRYNPLGLLAFARASVRAPLYASESPALETNFAALGVDVAASPAFFRGGLVAELQPLSILNLWMLAEVIGFDGAFGFLQSFPDAAGDSSDTNVERLADRPDGDPAKNYAALGTEITFGATLQLKLGPVAARALFRLARPSYGLRAGDEAVYENRFDLLVPNRGWYTNTDVDLLWTSDSGLVIGARWTFARAFFADRQLPADGIDPNSMSHRLGPFLAYRFWSGTRGESLFDKPTLLLVVNWWLDHRFRTGADVSAAIPYVVLGFTFEGERFL